ncbi:fumarate hydratase, class I [Malaciobacter molluscorum LMG 25693]|uniref:Fumarate hydratase class I n=2 Tax=Malaciobacter molluscorum LMG 25693 TaxID=870501 RepID=A0AB33GVF8_9BACT|nr:fumarate hydratase [Malaciobacter molluscorum]AXX93508.1 fumarate hydratase, class I [Malaciobacter molluscorum LMG 25693]
MKVIKEQDIIDSIAGACQYISYYHPEDFVKAMVEAYEKEESQSAKNAIAQILINSKMCAMGHRPLCQDTGSVNIFIKVGLNAKLELSKELEEVLNEGVAKGYTDPDNTLRYSVVSDPAGERKNTKNNTPAVIHYSVDNSDKINITVAAKGGGSENKSKFTVLNPSDSIYDWVMENVKHMGAGWCPPGILGIGIGGNPEKAMLLAKESLMDHVDIHELKARGAKNAVEELRLKLYEDINKLGLGAQGLGGVTTVLDVKILDYPCHAASKPVAMIPNCAATRHIEFELDGNGAAKFEKPDLNIWPDLEIPMDSVKRVNIKDLTKENLSQFKSGDTLLLSGKILTARDAAHKKIVEYKEAGKPLPNGVELKDRFIYYVGPVDPVRDEKVGPAGPTTSTRMDKFTKDMMEIGIMGMIGKAERKQPTIDLIKEYKSMYLIATGGAAYLISQSIKDAKVLAFEEMGMEAIYEFEVKDMPVTVAVDTEGTSIHTTGPSQWNRL